MLEVRPLHLCPAMRSRSLRHNTENQMFFRGRRTAWAGHLNDYGRRSPFLSRDKITVLE
jgi:hypothetical protein